MSKCIFCEIAKGRAPATKVYEDDTVVAFFDIGAVAEFHTLVIPKRHAENIFDVPDEDLRDVISVVGKLSRLYCESLGLEHVQIISSNGEEAQQDAFHLHFHIVPRSKGDGQEIVWKTDESIRERFDSLLEKLEVARSDHS